MAFLALLLTGALALALKSETARAPETIRIMADGSVDPPTASIERDGDVYALTDDIYGSIALLKGDIVVDGAGYALHGTGNGTGIDVTALSSFLNLTIKNMRIKGFATGIELACFSEGIIYGNTITENCRGIRVSGRGQFSSFNNVISGNTVTNNENGIIIEGYSVGNIVSGNTIADNSNNGIALVTWMPLHSPTEENTISGNMITNNGYGIYLCRSSNNLVSRNTFASNAVQVYSDNSRNIWDDGFLSGGNYWSDYAGVDADGDGIGDCEYTIDAANVDRYPLMNP